MPSIPPFVDPETGSIDITQVLAEAISIGTLVGLFVAVALVPLALGFLLRRSIAGMIFTLTAQFVLAVGTGIVLIYVVSRGIQLADE